MKKPILCTSLSLVLGVSNAALYAATPNAGDTLAITPSVSTSASSGGQVIAIGSYFGLDARMLWNRCNVCSSEIINDFPGASFGATLLSQKQRSGLSRERWFKNLTRPEVDSRVKTEIAGHVP